MKLKYGLISCDSHAQLHKDAFTSLMSKERWGDRIPQIIEIEEGGGEQVERWKVNGKVLSGTVYNCPAAMEGSQRKRYPQRWEEVPQIVYQPSERIKALDRDGVDAEVLFPNPPTTTGTFFQGDAEFELACVRAYNDALAEWRAASDRFIPLALIPYFSPIETIMAEVERAIKKGHRGINMLAEPSRTRKGLKHLNDPFWEPLWAACQDVGIPVHWHGSAGLSSLAVPLWDGYTRRQAHTVFTSRLCATPAQLIPNLIFSGVLERYPRLKWVCAETGLGWMSYVIEGCDHEWERRRLWSHGLTTRPSELFRRQIYVDFWFERAGIELRHAIGLDNIMWESDYPHVTSTYPDSWKYIEETLIGVPDGERKKLLYKNAVNLYGLSLES